MVSKLRTGRVHEDVHQNLAILLVNLGVVLLAVDANLEFVGDAEMVRHLQIAACSIRLAAISTYGCVCI